MAYKNNKTKMTEAEAIGVLEEVRSAVLYTGKHREALTCAIDALKEKVNPTAHWIFSGDEDDYDGYYINCSKCGSQRKVYNRDYERDVPVACPDCGVRMNMATWEDQTKERPNG